MLEGIPHPDDPIVRSEKTSIGLGYFLMAPLLGDCCIILFIMCHDICNLKRPGDYSFGCECMIFSSFGCSHPEGGGAYDTRNLYGCINVFTGVDDLWKGN